MPSARTKATHRVRLEAYTGPDRLQRLPVELLLLILELVLYDDSSRSPSTMLALCRVSKTINTNLTPILYRSFDTSALDEESNEAVTKPILFLRTMISRPDLAIHVKTMKMKWAWRESQQAIPNADPKLIWHVHQLAGKPDCNLAVPWGVMKMKVRDAATLFLFAVEQLLLRMKNLEKLDLELGHPKPRPDYRWKYLFRARAEEYSLPFLKAVVLNETCRGPSMIDLSFFLALGPLAPKLSRLDMNAYFGLTSRSIGNSATSRLDVAPLANLRHLDLKNTKMTEKCLPYFLSACGPLVTFKCFPFYSWHNCLLSRILEALRPHRATLEEVTLQLAEGTFWNGDFDSPPKELRGFRSVKHLTLDTSCYLPWDRLADTLPLSLTAFSLYRVLEYRAFQAYSNTYNISGSSETVVEQLVDLSRDSSQFPLLQNVYLHSPKSRYMFPLEDDAMSEKQIARIEQAFRRRGISFQYLNEGSN